MQETLMTLTDNFCAISETYAQCFGFWRHFDSRSQAGKPGGIELLSQAKLRPFSLIAA